FGDEVEHLQIARGIADDSEVILELKQGNVPVIVLDSLLLELADFVLGQLEFLALLFRAFGPLLMVLEKRFAIVRFLSIGTAGDLHLDEPKIDSKLDLFLAVAAQNLANFDLARLVGPIAQQIVQIKTHVASSI